MKKNYNFEICHLLAPIDRVYLGNHS